MYRVFCHLFVGFVAVEFPPIPNTRFHNLAKIELGAAFVGPILFLHSEK